METKKEMGHGERMARQIRFDYQSRILAVVLVGGVIATFLKLYWQQ